MTAPVEPSDVVTPPSIGELLRRLIEQIGDLFRAELRLARSEVTSGITSARGAAVAIAVGATFLTASLLAFLGAMVGWLAPYVGGPGWAAFIVGVAAAVLGGISIMVGVGKLKAIRISPERTITRLKRDAEALKGDD